VTDTRQVRLPRQAPVQWHLFEPFWASPLRGENHQPTLYITIVLFTPTMGTNVKASLTCFNVVINSQTVRAEPPPHALGAFIIRTRAKLITNSTWNVN
jgi:hypothetical protein